MSRLLARAADPVAWGLAALGAVAVLYALGDKYLANDEGASYFIAQLDAGRLWESLITSEANGSPFYVLLHGWIGFGDSEFFMRLLPAFFGAATIPVVYLLGKRLDSRVTGAIAAVITTLSFYFIKHAQELRSYSLALFLSTFASLILVTSLQERRRQWWRWIAYSVVAAAAVYAHFFSALVLLAHGLAVLVYPNKRELIKHLLASLAAIAILIAPLAYFAAFKDVGQVDWIEAPTPEVLLDAVKQMSGVIPTAALILPLGLTLIGIFSSFRSRGFEWTNILLLGWLILPFAISVGISYVKPIFEDRYVLVSLSAFTIWQARGIMALKFNVLRAVAGVALAVLLVQGSVDWYTGRQEGKNWSRIARYVKHESTPEDASLFYAPTIMRVTGYYLGYYKANSRGIEPPPSLYPDEYWLGFSKTRFDPNISRIAEDAATHDQIWWVIGADGDPARKLEKKALKATLDSICVGPKEKYFGGALWRLTECSTT